MDCDGEFCAEELGMFKRSRFYVQGLNHNILLLALFLLLALSYIPAQISAAEEVSSEEYLEQGLADYDSGDYKSAMENFSEALFLDPNNKQAKDYLEKAGRKFLQEVEVKRESERIEILKRAKTVIAERKKKVKESYEKGIRHYKRGEFLRAGEGFNAVLEIEPEHKEAKKYLELIEKRLQDIVNKGEFRSVAELYYAQGIIFYIKSEWGKAISQWENVIKIDPSNKETSEFIEIAEKRRQEEEAFEKAEVLYRDGLASYNEGKINEAVKQLKEVIKFNPEHRKARELLAKAGEKVAEIKKEEEARKIRETVDKSYFRGIDYYAEGQFNKAIKEWKEVLRLNPTHAGAKEYLKKARDKVARASSRERERKTTTRSAKEEKIEVYYRQGINCYLAGEFKEAIRQWEEVLKMEPSHNGAREYVAKAKERLKISGEGIGYAGYEEEIEEYVKELETTGTTDEEKEELIAMHYQDGLVAYAHGDLSQAMKEWQIVLKLDPEHKKARRAIIKLQAEMERRKGKK
ncbi:MAG: tetratricopeptide repeat protein [bacterium]